MSDFYRRLDEKERDGRIARIFANRPENLHDYQGCANDAASRLTETKLPSSPAGGKEPVRKVLTRADIEKINEGNHSCGWTTGAVKNPNPACGCMCGTVYAPDGRAILSHSSRHGMRCQHADERGNLLAPLPEPLGADISGPKCPYCNEPMTLGDGSYWCMNKKCAEQFYPNGGPKGSGGAADHVVSKLWCHTHNCHLWKCDPDYYQPSAPEAAAASEDTKKCDHSTCPHPTTSVCCVCGEFKAAPAASPVAPPESPERK